MEELLTNGFLERKSRDKGNSGPSNNVRAKDFFLPIAVKLTLECALSSLGKGTHRFTGGSDWQGLGPDSSEILGLFS